MLSAEEQERFSRHLLLDGLGGKGQERICAGAVSISLPEAFAPVASACARALAASGVRALELCGPWSDQVSRECAELAPRLDFRLSSFISLEDLVSMSGDGARVRIAVASRDPAAELLLSEAPPESPADGAALGALAALEALKLLAGAGTPAAQPLQWLARE